MKPVAPVHLSTRGQAERESAEKVLNIVANILHFHRLVRTAIPNTPHCTFPAKTAKRKFPAVRFLQHRNAPLGRLRGEQDIALVPVVAHRSSIYTNVKVTRSWYGEMHHEIASPKGRRRILGQIKNRSRE
jgi:hypothetical protein